MRFPSRKKDSSQNAAPNPETSNPSDENTGRLGFIGRTRKRLADSYSSRYRIMVESSMPQGSTVAQIILGMVIGMITAYLVIPTELAGASPRHLSSSAIEQWVRMLAVGHSESIHYNDANTLLVLQQIPNPRQVVERLAANTQIPQSERDALTQLAEIAGFDELQGMAAPADPGLIGSSAQIGLALAAVAIGVPVVVLIWRLFIFSNAVAPVANRVGRRPDASGDTAPTPAATQTFQPWLEEETERSGRTHAEYGVPVLHTLSTYTKGRNYDDSFAIELGPEQGSRFLGECGISTATRVGDELQSVELWGFDMTSQETFAKVFAAPAAINDPSLQAVAANRVRNVVTDVVAAELGSELVLDTSTMRIQGKIRTVVYNYGGGAPNSGIESLQIEISAWQKQSQEFGAPTGDYTDMQFVPPAQMPSASPAPPPPASGQFDAPQPPKPPRRPEDDDSDPFGGTGNFMPSS